MSAALSPILGIIIDKIGKRAIFITTSSFLVALACFVAAICPYSTEPNYTCLLPLIIVGFGYSIYASALWSSIPYIVPARTIGSAFGLTMSILSTGLTIAPLIVGVLEDRTPYRYENTFVFLGCLSLIGMVFNIWLYYDDIKNQGSTLNNVPAVV
jgi:MFS family permease